MDRRKSSQRRTKPNGGDVEDNGINRHGADTTAAEFGGLTPPRCMTLRVDAESGALLPFEVEPPTLDVFPLASSDTVFSGCRDRVVSLAVDPIGHQIAAASWDGFVRLWDVATGNLLGDALPHGDWVNCVAFVYSSSTSSSGVGTSTAASGSPPTTPSQTVVTGCEDGHLTWWSLQSFAVDFQLKPGYGAITSLGAHDDLIIATSIFNVYVASFSTRSVLRKLSLRHDGTCVAIQKDGQTLFVGQQDGRVTCWDVVGGFQVRELVDPGGGSSAPAGQKAATVNLTSKWKQLPAIRSLALDPTHHGGTFLITANDLGRIAVWSTASGELIWALSTHGGKPIVSLSVIVRRRKRRAAPPPVTPASPWTSTGAGATGLASPSKIISPKFHEASQAILVSCGMDGTVFYHDLDSKTSVDGHGSYAWSLAAYVDVSGHWRVAVGDNTGRVKHFSSTSALQLLDDLTAMKAQ